MNQTDRKGHHTKNVVVRGWPSCIFCSARDESKWEVWPEIKSRFLISSPNMIHQKYKESTKLISQKIGKPNLIQQEIIISDIEMENAKQYIYYPIVDPFLSAILVKEESSLFCNRIQTHSIRFQHIMLQLLKNYKKC